MSDKLSQSSFFSVGKICLRHIKFSEKERAKKKNVLLSFGGEIVFLSLINIIQTLWLLESLQSFSVSLAFVGNPRTVVLYSEYDLINPNRGKTKRF